MIFGFHQISDPLDGQSSYATISLVSESKPFFLFWLFGKGNLLCNFGGVLQSGFDRVRPWRHVFDLLLAENQRPNSASLIVRDQYLQIIENLWVFPMDSGGFIGEDLNPNLHLHVNVMCNHAQPIEPSSVNRLLFR